MCCNRVLRLPIICLAFGFCVLVASPLFAGGASESETESKPTPKPAASGPPVRLTPSATARPSLVPVPTPSPTPGVLSSPGPSPSSTPVPFPSIPPLGAGKTIPAPPVRGTPVVRLSVSNAIGMAGTLLRTWEGAAIERITKNPAVNLFSPLDEGDVSSLSLIDSAKDRIPDGGADWIRIEMVMESGGTQGEAPAGNDATAPAGSVRTIRLYEKADTGWVLFSTTVYAQRGDGSVERQEEYRGGGPYAAWEYSSSGQVLREERYPPGSVIGNPADQVQIHVYSSDRISRTFSYGGGGDPVFIVSYDYSLSGRVRETERWWADGRRERYSYRFGGGNTASAWADSPEDGIRWLYDERGRLKETEDWKAGSIVRRIRLTYAGPDSSTLVSRESVEGKGDHRVIEIFDDRGRVVQIDESRSAVLVSRTIQAWDDEDRLFARQIANDEGTESWNYTYDNGTLVSERYAKNEVPVKVTTYHGNERIEELYMNGKALLRVYYREGVRYQEEELRDGAIVRQRQFGTP